MKGWGNLKATDKQKIEIYKSAVKMSQLGINERFISSAVKLAEVFEGAYDLMIMWEYLKDTDCDNECSGILADLQDFIDEVDEKLLIDNQNNIVVTYDGEYPNACSGTLTILKNEEIIYKKKNCCKSGGSCYFDDNWYEIIESGNLIWDRGEIKEIPEHLRGKVLEEVNKVLKEIKVCCGGCL